MYAATSSATTAVVIYSPQLCPLFRLRHTRQATMYVCYLIERSTFRRALQPGVRETTTLTSFKLAPTQQHLLGQLRCLWASKQNATFNARGTFGSARYPRSLQHKVFLHIVRARENRLSVSSAGVAPALLKMVETWSIPPPAVPFPVCSDKAA